MSQPDVGELIAKAQQMQTQLAEHGFLDDASATRLPEMMRFEASETIAQTILEAAGHDASNRRLVAERLFTEWRRQAQARLALFDGLTELETPPSRGGASDG